MANGASPCRRNRRPATETRRVMIDFGYTPEVLLNNMDILNVDPSHY